MVLSHQKRPKINPRGDTGRLIGFDAELKSYKILMDDGKLINSNDINFLDFESPSYPLKDHDELFIEKDVVKVVPRSDRDKGGDANIKVNEEQMEDEELGEDHVDNITPEEEDSGEEDDLDVAETLVSVDTVPVGRCGKKDCLSR